jgi:glycine/D-amino acid oxidase-like deaminating enzyme/nitrite reductase/ring-hydroxylating ferredoxin subunit
MGGNDHTADLEGKHRSIWLDTTHETAYDPLEGGLSVDTVVVGGGIAGITTAVKLQQGGQRVALVERDRILEGVTGHTTAKLTSLHGLIYHRIKDKFGRRRAREYANANQTAIDEVEELVGQYDIDCAFERTPAYTYVRSPDAKGKIRNEVRAAKALHLPANYTESTDLPFEIAAAVRFDDQARFHPRKFLLALAQELVEGEGYVFEQTTAEDVETSERPTVVTSRGDIEADDVVIATHFPIFDHAFFFARMSPKRSYVLAASVDGSVPEGMYYRSGDPYFSVRPQPNADESLVLLGGQNHRTGHGGSTIQRYRTLEREARARFDVESIEYRWSTQDYVSVDGVPFVGKHVPWGDHVYVATGFGGWGMTNGVAAGIHLSNFILGGSSPWRRVFRPSRLNLAASGRKFVSHNKHTADHYVRDAFAKHPAVDLDTLDRGQAKVFDTPDDPVAVYRDEDGAIHAVSAICTHMGCLVEWNDGEESWDCPCHGSRFGIDGTVLDTPAIDDLSTYDHLVTEGK